MAYLGREAAKAPIVTADIPDDSITSAKIVAGTVAASDVAADVATQGELDAQRTNSSITTLGTVTAGNLSNTAIVYPSGHVITQVATQTLSGSSNDFTIDTSAKRFTVLMNGTSMTGGAHMGVQIGDAGGIETTGYKSLGYTSAPKLYTNFFLFNNEDEFTGDWEFFGVLIFEQLQGTETWVGSGVGGNYGVTKVNLGGGTKTLSGEITTVKIITTGTFDAGTVSVNWE